MRRRTVNSLLALMSTFIMVLSPSIQTLAADTTQIVTTEGSQGATVTYEQNSSFNVTIPKAITLGSDKTASYTVKVNGDISGDEIIKVVPDATVTLSDSNGKDSVTGAITQAVTEFNSTDVNTVDGTSTTGSITANDLSAGDWTGTFQFEIGIE